MGDDTVASWLASPYGAEKLMQEVREAQSVSGLWEQVDTMGLVRPVLSSVVGDPICLVTDLSLEPFGVLLDAASPLSTFSSVKSTSPC